MRKFATILLLAIFSNSFFYYAYFSFSIIKAKIEAACNIADRDSSAKLMRVSVKDLQKDESGEAWHENKLYDVAKRESVNGIEYVYLMRDEDEQSILNVESDYFKNNGGFFFGNGYRSDLQKKSPSITDYNYVIATTKKLLSCGCVSKFLSANNKYCFHSKNGDVPTPPPKFQLLFKLFINFIFRSLEINIVS